jgi:hypothetical protein
MSATPTNSNIEIQKKEISETCWELLQCEMIEKWTLYNIDIEKKKRTK